MSEPELPIEPFSVKALSAIVRALPAGKYLAMNWLAYWPAGPFWWKLPRDVGGCMFRGDLRDLLAREVCVTGRYEPQETILLQYLLGPGHTFVDVGANWGYFTLVGASLVGPSGRVVSVEADPRACRALAANVAKNALSTVTVVEAAADDREGVLTLNTYGTYSDDFSNYGVVMSSQAVAGMRTFTVPARPLDDILDQAGVTRVDLLKMDIEGAEGHALSGLRRRLAAGDIERILIELHPDFLEERGESAAGVVADLRPYGYHVMRVEHTPDMHRRAAAGSVPLASLIKPLAAGDDLGRWPHLLLTRKPLANESQRPRVLFVNSGILGHRAVAALLEDVSRLMDVSSEHINLSGELTLIDRIQRWILSRRFTPRTGAASNLDLRRWREELNVGLFAARRIAAARRANQFDVVHFHPQPTAYASLSLMKRQKAIVSIDATQQLASEETRSPLDRATYVPNMKHDGWVFRRARAIVSTSEWAARSLAANYPDCARKAHVLPYPVRSCADASLVEARYARAKLKHAPVRVLFMGGDFPRKGGFDLLDAWRSAAFGDRATLDLVTDWPIDARDVPPGARVIGGVAPNTPAWEEIWRDADLFVMPTRHEAFGMVFQEAAAAGVPVLATSVNAVPEIVRDGVTGVLVAPGDGRALVAALRTLVDSADLRRRMGAAALERMREEGSTERYARKLEGIIHSVMDAGDADGNGDSSKVLSTPPPHLPTPAIARPHGTLQS